MAIVHRVETFDPKRPVPVNMQMSITPESLVNLAVVRHRGGLNKIRTATEAQLAQLQKRRTTLGDSLLKDATVQVTDAVNDDPSVADLLAALAVFTGKKHTSRVVAVNHSRYGADNNEGVDVDVDKKVVRCKVQVIEAKTRTESNPDVVIEKEYSFNMPAAMTANVAELRKLDKQIAEISEKLLTIKKNLANVSALRDDVSATITEMGIRGQLVDGEALCDAVLGVATDSIKMLGDGN
jgi:hypothetical protein